MERIADYQAAVRWIQSNIRGPADIVVQPSPYTLDERRQRRLARLRNFLDQIGTPQRQFTAFHVAGTSGKGSVCAVLASISIALGWRTGLHVSPYLQTPLEKLIINGRPMNIQRFVALVEFFQHEVAVFNATSPLGPLRYGELWVALTFAAYAAERVTIGIVEVGSGGRWDCTNILEPSVCFINRIGYDHVLTLGPTIRDIAHHKAGIIKPGIPVVVSQQPEPEALEVIIRESQSQSAPLYIEGRDFSTYIERQTDTLTEFTYSDPDVHWEHFSIPLLGEHQVHNAGLAIAGIRAHWPFAPREAIEQGLSNTKFPGRLERIQDNPEVYLDGAHNAQKAEALIHALEQLRHKRKLVLVLGTLTTHQPEKVIELLAPHAQAIVCTTVKVIGKTAVLAHELADIARSYCPVVYHTSDINQAIDRALELAGTHGFVCVTGSLYLVGAARERWITEADILASAWPDDEDPLPASCHRQPAMTLPIS